MTSFDNGLLKSETNPIEFDFRKKVKVQLYRSNIMKNVETMF